MLLSQDGSSRAFSPPTAIKLMSRVIGDLRFIGYWLGKECHQGAYDDHKADKKEMDTHETGLSVGFQIFDVSTES